VESPAAVELAAGEGGRTALGTPPEEEEEEEEEGEGLWTAAPSSSSDAKRASNLPALVVTVVEMAVVEETASGSKCQAKNIAGKKKRDLMDSRTGQK